MVMRMNCKQSLVFTIKLFTNMNKIEKQIENLRTLQESYDALAAETQGTTQKIEEIGQDIKALDADVLQGKRKLAAAITQKGVRTAYTESLSDMAINVSAIPQTTYTGDSNFDAMVMPSEYMWNVYKIAEDLIGNNPYPYANRFFVAEYYRGYDSLVLSGADAYLTCDGDYYEVMGEQCIHTRPDGTQEVLEGKDPNHIWHDSDNGKMNRYVVFFFQADTYTFSNTTAAICPRRVAISGNCASFVVTGENRLTDVWVLGTLEHFEGGTTGDTWNKNIVFKMNNHTHGVIFENANDIVNLLFVARDIRSTIIKVGKSKLYCATIKCDTISGGEIICEYYKSTDGSYSFESLAFVSLVGTRYVGGGAKVLYTNSYTNNHLNCKIFEAKDLITIDTNSYLIYSELYRTASYYDNIEKIVLPSLRECRGYIYYPSSGTLGTSHVLVDIEVGEMVTDLVLQYWNPTDVLADADKTATLINNIRNHILAKVSDNSGASTQLIFTVSTNMFNNVTAADPNLVADFGAKGWSFRGA